MMKYAFDMKRDYRNITELLSKPFIWQIELTNQCFNTCIGCPRQFMTRKIGFMKFKIYKKCIDFTQDYQIYFRPVLLHHFGESLLHQKLHEFIAYAKQRKVPTALSCNPDKLTEQLSEKILTAGLKQITFSLDGMDIETLQKIRGKSANYTNSVRQIEKFINLRNSLKVNCEIRIQMIAFKQNKHQWKKFLSRWKSQDVYAYIKSFDSWTYPKFHDLSAKDMTINCNFPLHSIVVLWNGDIVPCCHDFNGSMVLGNITAGIENVWKNSRYQEFRKNFQEGTIKPQFLCKSCTWWKKDRNDTKNKIYE